MLNQYLEALRESRIAFLKSLVKDPVKTTMLPSRLPIPDPSKYSSYGYLGLDDFTMDPLIRPGSFVEVDTRLNELLPGPWLNEYERPVYIVALRDGYACGWCELQGNQLLVVPYIWSHASTRRFHYPKEAEIVGRVIGYDTLSDDEKFGESDRAKPRKQLKVKRA